MSQDSIRTCLVTGEKLSPSQLLRFVIRDGKLVFDKDCERPQEGRGGYIKDDEKVLDILKNNPKMKGKIGHFMKVKKGFEL